jgi:sugar/nucleoside kinase (ribokinase family)
MKYVLNGVEVTREEWLKDSKADELLSGEGVNTLVAQSSAGWPKTSDSMAVHPSQAKEAYEQARKLGVPTEFRPDGRPVLTDPGHQKKLARALGMVDLGERTITSRRFGV